MSRWIVDLLLPLPFMAGCSGSSEIAGDEPAVVEEVAGHEMEHPPLRRAGPLPALRAAGDQAVGSRVVGAAAHLLLISAFHDSVAGVKGGVP
jgi:hypothetical protein